MEKKWNVSNVQEALQAIKIATPCHVPITEMEDRGSFFHCHECQLNVYHFSTLSNDQIADLLNQNHERLCVGMFKREDGTIITKDCPLGLKDVGLVYRRQGFLRALAFLFALFIGTGSGDFFEPVARSLKSSLTHPRFIQSFTEDRKELNLSSVRFLGRRSK